MTAAIDFMAKMAKDIVPSVSKLVLLDCKHMYELEILKFHN